MSDIAEDGFAEAREAARENIAQIMTGSAGLNRELVDRCAYILTDIIKKASDAKSKSAEVKAELGLSGETQLGHDLPKIQQASDRIYKFLELLVDPVTILRDIYRRHDTIEFVLAQAASASALMDFVGFATDTMDNLRNPEGPSVGVTLTHFANLIPGFAEVYLDSAITELESLSRHNRQMDVVLGGAARERQLERQGRRVGEIETLAEKNLGKH